MLPASWILSWWVFNGWFCFLIVFKGLRIPSTINKYLISPFRSFRNTCSTNRHLAISLMHFTLPLSYSIVVAVVCCKILGKVPFNVAGCGIETDKHFPISYFGGMLKMSAKGELLVWVVVWIPGIPENEREKGILGKNPDSNPKPPNAPNQQLPPWSLTENWCLEYDPFLLGR